MQLEWSISIGTIYKIRKCKVESLLIVIPQYFYCNGEVIFFSVSMLSFLHSSLFYDEDNVSIPPQFYWANLRNFTDGMIVYC